MLYTPKEISELICQTLQTKPINWKNNYYSPSIVNNLVFLSSILGQTMYEPSYSYTPQETYHQKSTDDPLVVGILFVGLPLLISWCKIAGYILSGLTIVFVIIGTIMGLKLYTKHKAKKLLIEQEYKDFFISKGNVNGNSNDQHIIIDKKNDDDANKIISLLGPNSVFLMSVQEAIHKNPHVSCQIIA